MRKENAWRPHCELGTHSPWDPECQPDDTANRTDCRSVAHRAMLSWLDCPTLMPTRYVVRLERPRDLEPSS